MQESTLQLILRFCAVFERMTSGGGEQAMVVKDGSELACSHAHLGRIAQSLAPPVSTMLGGALPGWPSSCCTGNA